MDETRDKLVGGTQEELKEARDELEAPQEDELELNDAHDPTKIPVYDDGGKDPCPFPSFALATKAEGGIINGDAAALAQSLFTFKSSSFQNFSTSRMSCHLSSTRKFVNFERWTNLGLDEVQNTTERTESAQRPCSRNQGTYPVMSSITSQGLPNPTEA